MPTDVYSHRGKRSSSSLNPVVVETQDGQGGIIAAVRTVILTSVAIGLVMTAQVRNARIPRFEDFPITEHWNGVPATVRLTTPWERMFRTRLSDAGKKQPNFAGHYRIVIWGCGSNCRAGAVVDLTTGSVFPPPLAAHGEGWDHWAMGSEEIQRSIDSRANSRLAVVRSMDVPDVYYFVWENDRFTEILHTTGRHERH